MRKMVPAALAATMMCGMAFTPPATAAVRYSFQAFSSYPSLGNRSGSFELITTDFLSETTFRQDYQSSSMESCSVANAGYVCAAVQSFFPTLNTSYDTIGFGTQAADGTQFFRPYYNFADGAFSAYGTYSTLTYGNDQAGLLVVSEVNSGGSAAPEPASWLMMIGGFGLVGAAMRRSKIAVSFA